MRFQAKPFAVEIRRSRKKSTDVRQPVAAFLGEVAASHMAAPPTSAARTSAESLFGGLLDPDRQIGREGEDQIGKKPSASEGVRSIAERILPDLTWLDPLKAHDEPPPAARPRTKDPQVRRQRFEATTLQPRIDLKPMAAPKATRPGKSTPADVRDEPEPVSSMMPLAAAPERKHQDHREKRYHHRPKSRNPEVTADRATPSLRRGERWKRRLPRVMW